MKNEKKNSFSLFGTSSPEVRAFVQQQLQAFEPFLLPETQISVEVTSRADGLYRVTISLITGDTTIKAHGNNKDIFAATQISKSLLLTQLQNMQDQAISSRERDLEIHQAYKKTSIH